MSDASFLAQVGVRVDPSGVQDFEKLVLRTFDNIAREAQRRQSQGESLSGISSQFQGAQTDVASVIGASTNLPSDVRQKLQASAAAAEKAAAARVAAIYAQAGVTGAAGFSPLSSATVAAQTAQSRQGQLAQDTAARDAARSATAAAAVAAKLAQPPPPGVAEEATTANTDAAARSRLLAGSDAFLRSLVDASTANNELTVAQNRALAGSDAYLRSETEAATSANELSAARTRELTGSIAFLESEAAAATATNDLAAARSRVLAGDDAYLTSIERAAVDANDLSVVLALSKATSQEFLQSEARAATATTQLAEQRSLVLAADAEYIAATTAAALTAERGSAAQALVTAQARAAQPTEDVTAIGQQKAQTDQLAQVYAQRVKLAELGLTEVAGETTSDTQVRIAAAERVTAEKDSLALVSARLKAIQAGNSTESEASAIAAQRIVIEKELNSELNARVQQEIKNKVASGEIPAGSLFQQAQLATNVREGGPARLPTDFPTLGQNLASRATTTAGFALAGLGTYGAITGLKDVFKSEQDVQQAFTVIQGQLTAFGNGQSLAGVRAQIAGIAADTGTAEASIAQVFPEISGAFQNIKVALADAQTAAQFAKITRTDLQATTDSLVPASLAFGVSFQTITDSALGIQERTGVAAARTIQLFSQFGPVAAQFGLSLQQVGAIAASVLQDTSRTPQSVAEDFNRLIPQLQSKAGNIADILQQSGTGDGPTFVTDITTGKTGAAIQLLIQDYTRLSATQQQALEAAAGSGRGAKDIVDLLLNQGAAVKELDRTQGDAGKTQEYFTNLQKDLGQQLSQVREQLLQFGRALLESGVASAFGDILNVVILLIDGVKQLADFFVFLNDHTDGTAGKILEIVAAAKALQLVLTALRDSSLRDLFTTIASKIPGLGGIGGGTAGTEAAASSTAADSITAAGTQFQTTVVTAAEEVAAALRSGGTVAAGELQAAGGAAATELETGAGVAAAELKTGGAAGAGAGVGGAETGGAAAAVGETAGTGGAAIALGPAVIIAAVGFLAVKLHTGSEQMAKAIKEYADALTTASDDSVRQIAAKKPSTVQSLENFFFSAPTQQTQAQNELRRRQAASQGIPDAIGGAIQGGLTPPDLQSVDFSAILKSSSAEQNGLRGQFIDKLRENGTKELPDLLKEVNKGNQAAIDVAGVYVTALRSNPDLGPKLSTAIKNLQNATANVPDPKTGQSTADEQTAAAQAAVDAFASGDSSLSQTLQALNLSVATAVGSAKATTKAKLDKFVSDSLLQDQQLANSLEKGSSDDDASKVASDVALFNLPQFTDPTDRLNLAKQVVTDLKAQLTAESSVAASTAARAKLLQDGLAIPDNVRQLLGQEIVDKQPIIQDFFSKLGLFNSKLLDTVSKETIALVAGGKDTGDALVTALQQQLTAIQAQPLPADPGLAEAAKLIRAHESAGIESQLTTAKGLQAGLNAVAPGVAGKVTLPASAGTGANALTTQDDLNKALADQKTAEAGGDKVAAAKIAQDLANQDLKAAQAAGDDVKVAQARAAQARASQQLDAAQAEVAKANDSYQAALVTNDPVAAAKEAVKIADDNIAAARKANDTVGLINAQISKVSAQQQLNKALADVGSSQLELVKAQLTASGDLIGAAEEQVKIVQKEISDAVARGAGPTELNGLQGQLLSAQTDVGKTTVSFTEQQIQDNLDLQRITVGQAVAQLRALEALQTDQASRDEIEKRVRQLLNSTTDLQFNLPSVVLPTSYEVSRSSALGPGAGYQDNRSVVIQSLTIANGMDQAAVTQMLQSAIGSTNRTVTTASRRT